MVWSIYLLLYFVLIVLRVSPDGRPRPRRRGPSPKTISTDYSRYSCAAGQPRAAAPRRPPRGREEDGLTGVSSGAHRPFPLDWCPMDDGQCVGPNGNVGNFIKRAAPGGAPRRRALLRRRSAIRAAGHRASIGCHGTGRPGVLSTP
eukprot:SAG31_NODE_317_length_17813_cov_5.788585_18_plen_146_part_00